MPTSSLPAPLSAFHASTQYRIHVQDVLARREAQRRTVAFSDPQKLAKIPLTVLSQQARDAFKANHAIQDLNVMRNRYSDIVPYDATRVTLGQCPAEQSYINASWLREPAAAPRSWIASQAPMEETVHDFLSLFLDNPGDASGNPQGKAAPRVILMLTACRESGREKSARYWPTRLKETLEVKQYIPRVRRQSTSGHGRLQSEWQEGSQPPIFVTFVSSSPSSEADATHHRGWRTNELLLARGDSHVTVYQIEYLGWQDHGVPDSPSEVLQLLKHVNSLLDTTADDGTPSSLVTHCSAGVGRTGSFIAIAWLQRLCESLATSGSSCLADLARSNERSPLGPVPSTGMAGFSAEANKPARGLLPSFLQKGHERERSNANTQQASVITPQNLDFVMATIDNLRDQRTTMVQTPKQVEFVYEVVKLWWEDNAA